jgi:hypothetical protein
MPVTNDQVAALRALLAGEVDLHARLFERLDQTAAETGYTALIAAAFFEAVDRRFAKEGTAADVIDFVGDLRSRSDRLADVIDPKVAERLIWHALGEGSIADLDTETKASHQFLLLGGLVAGAHFDAAGLDEFLATARELGDRLIGDGAGTDP